MALFALMFVSEPASAYLDGGSVSMLLQALVGGIAGAMAIGKLYWQRIRGWYRFPRKENNGTESE